MATINLFDFFDEAAEILAKNIGLDLTNCNGELESLRGSYGGCVAVDYSSALRKYVYLKNYAAKHALVWRVYISKMYSDWSLEDNEKIGLNSIGSGPASEIIGIAESMEWGQDAQLKVTCLEGDLGWATAGRIVADLYRNKTKRIIELNYTDKAADLLREGLVVGSMVVTDLARAGRDRQVLAEVCEYVKPASGLFLDAKAYRSEFSTNLTSHCLAGYQDGRYVDFQQDKIDEEVKKQFYAEWFAQVRPKIQGVSTIFNMNAYVVKFS